MIQMKLTDVRKTDGRTTLHSFTLVSRVYNAYLVCFIRNDLLDSDFVAQNMHTDKCEPLLL